MLFYNRPWYNKYMEHMLELEYAILLIFILIIVALIRNKKTKFLTNYLKDHSSIYRRFIGGKWYKWKGHWEQETIKNANYHLVRVIEYKRGYLGKYPDGKTKWKLATWLSISSPDIEDIKNY